MPVPIQISGAQVDLGQRFDRTTTVSASPAAASETVIGTVVVNTDETLTEGIDVDGWAAFTIGTSGTASQLRIRKTNVSGTVIADSGACSRAAGNVVEQGVNGFDSSPALNGQTYVLTLQITAGAATSTVSALCLRTMAI